jgi:hypothetical protein
MTKFNNLVESILKEGVLGALGSAAKFATTAAGTAISAAEKPGETLSSIMGDIKSSSQEKENLKKSSYGMQNPPKIGDLAVYSDNKEIIGKVMTKIDKQGQFGIRLIKPDDKVSEFEFVKTNKRPYWHINYVNIVTDNHISGKDVMLKEKDAQGKDVLQVSPTDEIPYVMVGKGTKFENWIPYEYYLEDQKKNKK